MCIHALEKGLFVVLQILVEFISVIQYSAYFFAVHDLPDFASCQAIKVDFLGGGFNVHIPGSQCTRIFFPGAHSYYGVEFLTLFCRRLFFSI